MRQIAARAGDSSQNDRSGAPSWSPRRIHQVIGSVLAISLPAFAHDDTPHPDLPDWTFDPLVIGVLFASALLYIVGIRGLWHAGGRGSGISVRQSLAFAGGWISMFIALVSPLHSWGEMLFSAHMTQHEILMLVAAPLLVLGRPFVAYIWAFPKHVRVRSAPWVNDRRLKSTWRIISAPFAAWVIHAVALWIWHIPALFQATLHSNAVHTVQHASFFLSAMLFWWAIIYGRQGVQSYGAGVLYLFTTSIQSGLLGVLLTLTTRIWYPAYSDSTVAWGLSPLEDQQIGGLIMWIPAGIVYVLAALIMFAAWLRESESRLVSKKRNISESAAAPTGL